MGKRSEYPIPTESVEPLKLETESCEKGSHLWKITI